MAGNSFGQAFRITTAGESHGPGNVVIIDGMPSGIELSEALRMATLYPSRLAAPERGKIEPGARADVLVFTPDFEVQAVYLQGRNIFGR